ncbi:MAG: hypothetical protein JW974_01410 [Alphaproteobacteria bacterium]|nr:hypothetical protein [Alphaproteobacteria bacterium]MBN2675441.1 hypothetical protein [Alphaproteobacteria bacterium]
MNVALDGTTIMAIPPDIWDYVRFLLFCLCIRMIWKGGKALLGGDIYKDIKDHLEFKKKENEVIFDKKKKEIELEQMRKKL